MSRTQLLAAAVLLAAGTFVRADNAFLGKTSAAWQRQLSDARPEVRRGAAFALGKCGSTSALPALVRALGDADATVREAAAYAVGEVAAQSKDPGLWREASGALRKMLAEEPDGRARRSVAYAVGNFGPEAAEARPDLERALDHKDPLVRQNAAWALGRLKEAAARSGVERLAQALRDEDALVRRDAAAALGDIGRPTATPALRALIGCVGQEKEAAVRSVAIGSLVGLVGPGDAKVAPELRELLRGEDRDVRRGAALALANVGGAEARAAVGVLVDALRDDDPTARELAAAALANVGEAAGEAVPALGKALSEDRSPVVRRNAALALARVGSEAGTVVQPLVRALDAKEPADVRMFAAEALAHVGRAVDAVVPQLLAVLRDDRDAPVRQRVVMALAYVSDLRKSGVAKQLEQVLDEPNRGGPLVRYDAARVLGHRLFDEAPPKAVEVLAEMLNNTLLREYKGTDPTLRKGDESVKSGSGVKENLGGDARYMAAKALAEIARSGKRSDALDVLRKAAQSKDEVTKKVAEDALKDIGKR
jgi:HEAT repeat protein